MDPASTASAGGVCVWRHRLRIVPHVLGLSRVRAVRRLTTPWTGTARAWPEACAEAARRTPHLKPRP